MQEQISAVSSCHARACRDDIHRQTVVDHCTQLHDDAECQHKQPLTLSDRLSNQLPTMLLLQPIAAYHTVQNSRQEHGAQGFLLTSNW